MIKINEKSALRQEIDNYNAVSSFCMLITKRLNNKVRRDYIEAQNHQFFESINTKTYDQKEPQQ